MESILVGDLHGDIQLYHQIKSRFAGEKICLLGDYLDSFIFTRTEQLQLMELILNDIESGVITEALLGNHEISYLSPDRHCSGYSRKFDDLLLPLKSRMHRLLKPFIWDASSNTLISHAGMTKPWFLENCNDMSSLDSCLLESFQRKETFFDVGPARGGVYLPGPLWCDYFAEFKAVEGIRQIFGHTPVKAIKERSNDTWPIDCLQEAQKQVLRIAPDQEPEIINL